MLLLQTEVAPLQSRVDQVAAELQDLKQTTAHQVRVDCGMVCMIQCMTPACAVEGSVPPCSGCSLHESLSTVIITHLSVQYMLYLRPSPDVHLI